MEKEKIQTINILLIGSKKEIIELLIINLFPFTKEAIVKSILQTKSNLSLTDKTNRVKYTIYTSTYNTEDIVAKENKIESSLSLIQTEQNCSIHVIFIIYSPIMQKQINSM